MGVNIEPLDAGSIPPYLTTEDPGFQIFCLNLTSGDPCFRIFVGTEKVQNVQLTLHYNGNGNGNAKWLMQMRRCYQSEGNGSDARTRRIAREMLDAARATDNAKNWWKC